MIALHQLNLLLWYVADIIATVQLPENSIISDYPDGPYSDIDKTNSTIASAVEIHCHHIFVAHCLATNVSIDIFSTPKQWR